MGQAQSRFQNTVPQRPTQSSPNSLAQQAWQAKVLRNQQQGSPGQQAWAARVAAQRAAYAPRPTPPAPVVPTKPAQDLGHYDIN
jgi:hypothetical protein